MSSEVTDGSKIRKVMRDVSACVSGIDVGKRSHIHNLITLMGGSWSADLRTSNTHLITNTIKSPKYQAAANINMKVMTEDWVLEVFKIAQVDTIYDPETFYQKFKLPIFYNINATSTGILPPAKNEIIDLINGNGGTYNRSFQSGTTVLICLPNGTSSKKFKAAAMCGVVCVTADWVHESVKEGFALPFDDYKVEATVPDSAQLLADIMGPSERPEPLPSEEPSTMDKFLELFPEKNISN